MTGMRIRRPGEPEPGPDAAAVPAKPPPVPLPLAAGNAAVAQLLRQPAATDAGATPAPAPEAPAKLSPADERRLVFARTTLANVKPLPEADEKTLVKLIPGSPILQLIQERDELRKRLSDTVDARDAGRTASRDGTDPQGDPGMIPGGPAGATWAEAIEDFQDRLFDLNQAIRDGCHALGIPNEEALVDLVEDRFPSLFLERAKTIALQVLTENEAVARKEAQRFGVVLGTEDTDVLGLGELMGVDMRMNTATPGAGGDPAAFAGIRAGAKELAELNAKIDAVDAGVDHRALDERNRQLADEEDMDWQTMEGQRPPSVSPISKALDEERGAAMTAFLKRKTELGLTYPILTRIHDFAALAVAPDAQIQSITGREVLGILSDIRKTKEAIADGDLKVWHLNDVFDMTMQDLGVTADSPLMKSVAKHVEEEERDESILDIAIAAIGFTAAILAAIPSAGTSLVIGGAVVATTAGLYQLNKSATAYGAEKAAENVALDATVADISRKEPDMGAVVFDLVGLGLDAADVVKAVKVLGTPIRTARATGDLSELARAAAAVEGLGENGTRILLSTIARESAVQTNITNVIEAVGKRFRGTDLAKIEATLARHGETLVKQGFDDLKAANRIRPLTEEALEEVYGYERMQVMLTKHKVMRADGFYDPSTGYIFLKGGNVDELGGVTLHEVVHYLQETYRPNMSTFLMEFEAYVAQRDYLRRLIGSGVDPDVAFPRWKWLAEADEAAIFGHLSSDAYKLYRPAGFDAGAAVRDALTDLGRIDVVRTGDTLTGFRPPSTIGAGDTLTGYGPASDYLRY